MSKRLFTKKQLHDFIKKYEPFSTLSEACLQKLIGVFQIEVHPGNTLLIKKGELLNDLYVLFKGRLYYQVTDDHGQITVHGDYGEGAVIGEMALLSDLPRSADVYTVRDSIILRLTKQDFLHVSNEYPELLSKLTQFTIQRLTRSMQGVQNNVAQNKSIAIIKLQHLHHFEQHLQKMVEQFPYGEKILLLTEEHMHNQGKFFDANGEINQQGILWINQQEQHYSFIFYLTESELSGWTKFCIRQADSIALVGNAELYDYALSPAEHYINDAKGVYNRRTILILLHHGNKAPKNTQYWLEKRLVQIHYHIHMDTDQGKARLMRVLTDHTVSLVLSGGGALGLSHIGVFRLLEERGIPIDHVAGTSMGSVVAGVFASEASLEQGLYVAEHQLVQSAKLDYTFPYLSIAKGRRVSEGIKKVFGEDSRIEDLWLNFFCVSTDLVNRDVYIHDRGLLWEAVRCSISLPMIYPPVAKGDKLLVDGGVLNNIPIDIMRNKASSSKIIASNIIDTSSFAVQRMPYELSGWKMLFSKLMHKNNAIPVNLADLVQRLLTISSAQTTSKVIELADCCIFLTITGYGLLDFKNFKEIADSGYEQSLEQFHYMNLQELLQS